MTNTISGRPMLPLIVFPLLSALAINFIWKRFVEANIGAQLGTQCQREVNVSAGSPRKAYFTQNTGFDAFDQAICPLVAFFDVMINSQDTLPFLTYTFGTSLPLVLFPNVEAYRNDRNYFLAYPVIFGLLAQVASLGVMFPIYWLVFIMSDGPKKAKETPLCSYTQAQAEAIVFGIIVGSAIPSIAMLFLNDFHVTAIWQFYPALVAIAQFVHLQVRPSSKYTSSGYNIMLVLYVGCYLISSSTHIATVWPNITNFASINQLLVPSIHPLPHSMELDFHLLDFLKWDITFAYSSTAIATLWYSNNFKQMVTIFLWYCIAIPIYGFGAAVMGVAIWKEGIFSSLIPSSVR